jgi:hypothetical protein
VELNTNNSPSRKWRARKRRGEKKAKGVELVMIICTELRLFTSV